MDADGFKSVSVSGTKCVVFTHTACFDAILSDAVNRDDNYLGNVESSA